MMRRCYVKTDKDYPKYGGVGINVHQPWHDYLIFEKDMGEPSNKQTLDRVDPYGDYTPQNCRWASPQTQARNIRIPKKSKTGVTGVLLHGGRYYACITVNGKKFYSKVVDSIIEAAAARKELERKYW